MYMNIKSKKSFNQRVLRLRCINTKARNALLRFCQQRFHWMLVNSRRDLNKICQILCDLSMILSALVLYEQANCIVWITFFLYTFTDQNIAILVLDSCWATERNGHRWRIWKLSKRRLFQLFTDNLFRSCFGLFDIAG